MTYYIAAKLQVPFDEAIVRTEAALKTEGFGVIRPRGQISDGRPSRV